MLLSNAEDRSRPFECICCAWMSLLNATAPAPPGRRGTGGARPRALHAVLRVVQNLWVHWNAMALKIPTQQHSENRSSEHLSPVLDLSLSAVRAMLRLTPCTPIVKDATVQQSAFTSLPQDLKSSLFFSGARLYIGRNPARKPACHLAALPGTWIAVSMQHAYAAMTGPKKVRCESADACVCKGSMLFGCVPVTCEQSCVCQ